MFQLVSSVDDTCHISDLFQSLLTLSFASTDRRGCFLALCLDGRSAFCEANQLHQ
jgi:hypothetical protein